MGTEAGAKSLDTSMSGEEQGRVHYALVVLVVALTTTAGALGLGRFGYTLLLPAMKEGLGLSYTQTGLLATWNLLGYLVLSGIGGAAAARYGPRLVISVSMLLAGAGMVLTGWAPDFFAALVARTVTGAGSAGANIPVLGLLSAWFASRRRGMATGMAVGGSGVALVLTGPLLPPVVAAYGWRTGWFLLGALGLLIGVAAFLLLRDSPAEKGLRPFGESQQQSAAAEASPAAEPDLRRVYRSPVLWYLGAVYAMYGFGYIIYTTYFATYLTGEGGWTAAAAGSLWAIIGVLSIVSGFIWGTISDRIGRKYGLALVFAGQGLSILVLALARTGPGFYTSAILFGLTAWSIPGIMAAACGDYVGARMAPAAMGLISVVLGIGQALGPSVAGFIADSAGSFVPALILAAVAEGLGATGALALKRPATD